MAASGASATANRAATGAVIAVLLVVGLVVALNGEEEQLSAGTSSSLAQGGNGASRDQAGREDSPGEQPGDAEQRDGLSAGEDSTEAPDAAAGDASSPGLPESGSPLGELIGDSGRAADSSGGASDSGDSDSGSGSVSDINEGSSGTAGTPNSSSGSGEGTADSGASTENSENSDNSENSENSESPGDSGGSDNSDGAAQDSLAGSQAAQAGGARVVDKRRVDEQTLDLTVYSPALGHKTGVRLLLPRDWSNDPGRSWPTLYMLPGYHHGYEYDMRDYGDWTYYTDVEQFMADKNVLTVLPSDGGSGSFTDWWNDGNYGTPEWQTYHTRELPALLESAYRASSNRAIAGLSLAGYGAVEYAVDNPEMYNGVASYSGLLHTTAPGVPLLLKQMWTDAGIDPEQVWGSRVLQRDVWRANNPYSKAGRLCGEDVDVFLSAGTGIPGKYDPSPQEDAQKFMRAVQNDTTSSYLSSFVQSRLLEAGTSVTTHLFESKLRAACGVSTLTSIATGEGGGVDITTDYTPTGTHRWEYWQDAFHESWPMLARSLGVAAG